MSEKITGLAGLDCEYRGESGTFGGFIVIGGHSVLGIFITRNGRPSLCDIDDLCFPSLTKFSCKKCGKCKKESADIGVCVDCAVGFNSKEDEAALLKYIVDVIEEASRE